MTEPDPHRSLWLSTVPAEPRFAPLAADVDVDVCVIGAGITGIHAARFARATGRTVALLDRGRIAASVTGYTTAKVTSQHGLRYATLVEEVGADHARAYAEANEWALAHIASTVSAEGIDCDLERLPAYVYTETPEEVDAIRREAEAAAALGLPASFTTDAGLPWPVAGALRFDDQAQFHPRRYLLHLVEAIPGAGSVVHEDTLVVDVEEGDPCTVRTADGHAVRCRDVVVATQVPFLARGELWAKAFPHRSYAVAVRAGDAVPRGMHITAGSPTRSLRSAVDGDGTRVLIVGGEGHHVGDDQATPERYAVLEQFARERLGLDEVRYRWSTQDYSAADGIPYVGRIDRKAEHVFAATGYSAWGMTNSVVAAHVIVDLLDGREGPWHDAYDARRLRLGAAAKDLVTGNLHAAKRFVASKLGRTDESDVVSTATHGLDGLRPGEGRLLEHAGRRVAAYRHADGSLSALDPACTHVGCDVAFNAAETSWDCPCHGSRFAVDGSVLNGPAIEPLPAVDLPTAAGTG